VILKEHFMQTEVLVIGSGIAGCITALELAERGVQVTLIGCGSTGSESNSHTAQGGIIFRGIGDSDALLRRDILQAGCGLCNPQAVDLLIQHGLPLVRTHLIEKYGVCFDRHEDASLKITSEAAHSVPRVIYHRDQTGQAIMTALLTAVKNTPNLQFLPNHTAVDLITLSHHSKNLTDIYAPSTCAGAYIMDNARCEIAICFAKETILATGGLGEVFLHTTNPKEARGDGVAMAYRAGARIMNMEYIQFHPTAFYLPFERRFLLSEALRGEGAEILTSDFQPFMHRYHEKGSLAPRDITARAIYQEMLRSECQHLWLDITQRDASYLKERFSGIYRYCQAKGFDLATEPVPIVPAAHYSCGGVAVDMKGRTTIQQLRAVGEVACTGLHGANRLASTSLLEGLVFGKLCAEDLAAQLSQRRDPFPPVEEWVMSEGSADSALIQQDWTTIKQTMWNYVGLVRDKARLSRALKMLGELKYEIDSFYDRCRLTPELLGLRNGVETALLVTQGALRNRHSIGCHYRLN
jgi:L-aspartate oxidase